MKSGIFNGASGRIHPDIDSNDLRGDAVNNAVADNAAIIADLARVKVAFQLRTICTAMGVAVPVGGR